MDEVDGVGAGDRGGVGALIKIIKESRTPIICICNDRDDRKLQSLLNHTYSLKFQRPQLEAIRKRVMSIAVNEGFTLDETAVDRLIEGTGNDVRQIINILQMWNG
jgi:replication factor C subunit 1